jgi:hypothetical protein
MKKKSLGITLVVSFFLLLLSPPLSHSVVKAGATCKKLGNTTTVSGKKYMCVKSGKKLAWNKGVAVSKPKPISTPTPTPTPSGNAA